jgi:Uma2 family endonuclease
MQSPIATKPLTDFLQQPNIETSPAWELIYEQAQQKPIPTLFHSRLQRNLVNAINQQANNYEAIQELRCIVPPMSPVPDITIVKRERLGEEDGSLQGSPDWLIEIRSPDQSTLEDVQKYGEVVKKVSSKSPKHESNHRQMNKSLTRCR